MEMRPLFAISLLLFPLQLCLGSQLIFLNVPPGVKLSTQEEVSLADIQALPFQLFGLDETQSHILSDVSFFRRPTLMALVTLACVGPKDPACTDAFSGIALKKGIRQPYPDLLLFRQSGSLAEAVATARLDKSLLASTNSLPDSSHPIVFAGADSAAPLADEVGLPEPLVHRMRLAQSAVDRALASGLLTDSQPDALHIDLTVSNAADLPLAVRRRVVAFALALANRLTTAAGRDRAFVAVAAVDSSDTASAQDLVRVRRSLLASTEGPLTTVAPSSDRNIAPDYDEDFPVIFNIILWLSVVLILAVYAVAYGLWNIDPGKDSIIYRRGYAHAKKD